MSVLAPAIHAVAALALMVVGTASVLTAQGQRLRLPQQSVFAAFPAADGYQVIIRNVDTEARRRIEGQLPFRVHFNDLGEHAVYVALRGRLPLGIVYLRGEEDANGLTEIEWAITLDMRIAGFRFQRTRNCNRQVIENSEFARLLFGCADAEVRGLLAPDGSLSDAARGVPAGAEELAAALARSALKALSVVDTIWPTEIQKMRDLAMGMRAFPTAEQFQRIWPPPRTDRQAPLPAGPGGADCSTLGAVVRAFGSESRPLGFVAEVSVPSDPGTTLTWIVDDAGVVLAADHGASAQASLRARCQEAVGRTVADAAKLGGPVGGSARALAPFLLPAARPGRDR